MGLTIMAIVVHYQHLEHRPSSNYQQLWVKGRHMRAEILYRLTVGSEPQTPQEVAQDYDLPLEVVQEAIEYAVQNQDLLDELTFDPLAAITVDESNLFTQTTVGANVFMTAPLSEL